MMFSILLKEHTLRPQNQDHYQQDTTSYDYYRTSYRVDMSSSRAASMVLHRGSYETYNLGNTYLQVVDLIKKDGSVLHHRSSHRKG